MSKAQLSKLLKIMDKLRHPTKGCDWDKKQTFESIIPHAIEEVYEVAEEINEGKYNNLKDELGDLLFQIVFLSQIAKEKKLFDFYDVINSISNKMVYRHPHIFKNKKFKNLKELQVWWEKSKKKSGKGLLDNIPNNLPAIIKANKIQKKVANIGFEYKNTIESIDKIIEEAKELKHEIKNKKNERKAKEELGDLIFATLDVARKLDYNPEVILSNSIKKFKKRWSKIELFIKKDKIKIENLNSEEFNNYWLKAKNKN